MCTFYAKMNGTDFSTSLYTWITVILIWQHSKFSSIFFNVCTGNFCRLHLKNKYQMPNSMYYEYVDCVLFTNVHQKKMIFHEYKRR